MNLVWGSDSFARVLISLLLGVGIFTQVTGTDLLIHTLMIVILDNESLITLERIRVYAFDMIFHGRSHPGDLGRCSYPYLDGHDLG